MRVDFHAHAWSDDYVELLARAGMPGARMLSGGGVGTTDVELAARFALMDLENLGYIKRRFNRPRAISVIRWPDEAKSAA